MTLELAIERRIETAKDLKTAIEVISETSADFGTAVLVEKFGGLFPDLRKVSLIPIMKGGGDIGRAISRGRGIKMNPMRMNYYSSAGVRLPKPICLKRPDINKIVDVRTEETKAVAFAEGVIDTEATLRGAMGVINGQIDELNTKSDRPFNYPEYYVFALISKVLGGPQIENCYWAFDSHPRIWVIGRSFDLNGKGRNLRNVVAIKDPHSDEVPKPPFVTPSKLLVAHLWK